MGNNFVLGIKNGEIISRYGDDEMISLIQFGGMYRLDWDEWRM
jgi:hypothetical protein